MPKPSFFKNNSGITQVIKIKKPKFIFRVWEDGIILVDVNLTRVTE